MPHVVVGDYATIIKAGEFARRKVSPGDRVMVLKLDERYSTKNKKVWATVDVIGKHGGVIYRINIPSWWLRPRSILDDLADV